jgi:hypothetical protein
MSTLLHFTANVDGPSGDNKQEFSLKREQYKSE